VLLVLNGLGLEQLFFEALALVLPAVSLALALCLKSLLTSLVNSADVPLRNKQTLISAVIVNVNQSIN